VTTGADEPERDKPVRRRPATERAMRRRSRREQHEGRAAAKGTTNRSGTGKTGTGKTGTGKTGTARGGTGRGSADGTSVRDRGSTTARTARERSGETRPTGKSGASARTRVPARDRPDGRTADTGRIRGSGAARASRSTPPTRRRVLLRRWVALSVLVGVVFVVVVVLFTPVVGVRSVQVTGIRGLTTEQVLAAAKVPDGQSLFRLDEAGITVRVAQLPRVASVDVSRQWPSTVHIRVTERDPVGVVPEAGGVHLVDSSGLDYATVTTVPTGLPKIQLTSVSPTDPTTQAVVRVLVALPAQLKAQLLVMGAKTPGSVTLTLTGGRTVRWGNAADSARKSAVLAALMTRPGKVYDVSSPDLPTIS
jgi:cell division protein FtsQ